MIFHHIYKIWILSQVAEQKSFKKVSVHCGMTQSALSQNLKALENFLGKTLLVREKGSVSLTADGRDLLRRFNPILQNIGEQYEGTTESLWNRSKLSIGAYDSISVNILPRFFPQLHRKYSEIKLEVQTSRSATLASQVRKGELDMALVTEMNDEDSVDVSVLAYDHFGVFVSARHDIASASLEELSRYGVAAISAGPNGHPRYYQKFLKLLGDRLPIVMTSDSFETVRSVALSGEIAGIMPHSVAQRFSGEFVEVDLGEADADKLGRHSICLISRKNTDPRLRALVLEELQLSLAHSPWGGPIL